MWGRLVLVIMASLLGYATASAQTTSDKLVSESGRLSFNLYEEIDLKTMVEFLAKSENINIHYQPKMLDEKVKIMAGTTMPRSSLRSIVEHMLASNGYVLVREPGGWLRVVKGREARAAPSRVTEAVLPPGDGVITLVRTLEVLKSQRAMEVAKEFLSPDIGFVYSVSETNTIILTDLATNLRRISSILSLLDKPAADIEMRSFPLRNALAETTGPEIERLLSSSRTLFGTSRPAPVVTVNNRTNSLIVLAQPDDIVFIERCIALLDIDTLHELAREVYELRHIGSATAVSLLDSIEQGPARKKTRPTYVAVPLPDGCSVLLAADEDRLAKLKQTLAQIDLPKALSASTERKIFTVNSASVESVAGMLTKVLGGIEPSGVEAGDRDRFSVIALPEANSILVEAPEAILDEVDELLETLDKPQPQILLQALFFSTRQFDETVVGVEGGTLQPDYLLQSAFGLRDFDSEGYGVSVSLPFGLTGAVFNRGEVTAVVNFLKTNTDSKILSGPVLLVENNKQANLDSVIETPYTETASLTSNTATTSLGGYAEAGMKVALTPRICKNGYVNLAVEISSSQFFGAQIAAEIPPAKQSNTVQTSLNLKDGDAVVIGGLSDVKVTQEVKGIPFLKDIPILGALFRKSTDSVTKNRFYVLIQPKIIRAVVTADVEDVGLFGNLADFFNDGDGSGPAEDLWFAPGEEPPHSSRGWTPLPDVDSGME